MPARWKERRRSPPQHRPAAVSATEALKPGAWIRRRVFLCFAFAGSGGFGRRVAGRQSGDVACSIGSAGQGEGRRRRAAISGFRAGYAHDDSLQPGRCVVGASLPQPVSCRQRVLPPGESVFARIKRGRRARAARCGCRTLRLGGGGVCAVDGANGAAGVAGIDDSGIPYARRSRFADFVTVRICRFVARSRVPCAGPASVRRGGSAPLTCGTRRSAAVLSAHSGWPRWPGRARGACRSGR